LIFPRLTCPATYLRFNPEIHVRLGVLNATVRARDPDAEKDPKKDGSFTFENYVMYMEHYRLLNDAISGAMSHAANVKLTNDQLLICRHLVRGYSLKAKKWREFPSLLLVSCCIDNSGRSGLYRRLSPGYSVERPGV
jgi:hypothetical protein